MASNKHGIQYEMESKRCILHMKRQEMSIFYRGGWIGADALSGMPND